jgi:hypothetical protein
MFLTLSIKYVEVFCCKQNNNNFINLLLFTYYMGAFTIFDILTDNPGIIKVKHNKNLYEWNNKVRTLEDFCANLNLQ